MTEAKRPNILFIMTDQFRGDIMSCVGGPAKTPNLDTLAEEGVLFTQCSTVAPLCIPARISMFTGKYPHTTGAWDNSSYVLSPDANIWSKQFRDLGYDTSLFGKTHLHGSSCDFIARECYVRAYGFDTVNEITGPHASIKSRTYMTDMWREKGYFEEFKKDLKVRANKPMARPSPVPLDDYYDVYVGRCGQEYIEKYSGDKPWFCHVSFGGPHEPWDTPEPYASLYNREDMPSPVPPMKNACPDRPRGYTDERMSKEKIRCSADAALEIRADYCGAVTLIDEWIGKIIDTVKARGEWDNTIVVFTSDHGEQNGDHGFVNKRTFLNGALNVPLIVRTPHTAKHGGKITDSLVSNIDIGPTIAELAGGRLDYSQFAVSLLPIINGEETDVRDYVLSELVGEVMYMDRDWKVVTNAKGEIYMLFDRKHDQNEQMNLAGSADMTEVTHILREKMLMALAENRCLVPSPLQQKKDY